MHTPKCSSTSCGLSALHPGPTACPRGFLPALLVLLGLCLLAVSGCQDNQGTGSPGKHSPRPLPDLSVQPSPDPLLVQGKLDNGLSWYIYPAQDGGPVEMRLLVDAGSMQETADQSGVAHFVEHMAFNGTTHFPPGTLLKLGYSESENAYTSQEETVYLQTMPENDPAKIEKTFLMFQDFAQGIRFDPAEVEKERGVLVEEWRRIVADNDGWLKWLTFLEPVNPVIRQMPIGSDFAIKKVKPETLKLFWDTWYRPERMAVVITGPVNVAEVEVLVKKYLAPLESHGPYPGTTPEQTWGSAEFDTATNRFHINPSGNYLETSFLALHARKPVQKGTLAILAQNLTDRLIAKTWNNRISRLIDLGKLPLATAYTQTLNPWRGSRFTGFGTSAKEGDVVKNWELTLQEARRIQLHGFSQKELDLAKAQLLTEIEAEHRARPKWRATELGQSILALHLGTGLFMDADQQQSVSLAFLDNLDKSAFDAAAREWFALDRLLVRVSVSTPNDTLLSQTLFQKAAEAAGVSLWDLPENDLPGLAIPSQEMDDNSRAKGSIVKVETSEDFDGEIWTLSNQSKVVWRKMEGSPRIVLRAIKQGGYASLDDSDVLQSRLLLQLYQNAGLGQLQAAEWRSWLEKEGLTLQFWVDDYFHGYVGGSASTARDKLEEFFKTIHDQVTRQGFPDAAFKRSCQDFSTWLGQMPGDWAMSMYTAIMSLRAQMNPRLALIDNNTLQHMDLTTMNRLWTELFGDAKDWVWVICGNAETKDLKDMAEKWLAALPTGPSPDVQASQSWTVPPKGLYKSVYNPSFKGSRIHLEVTGKDLPWPEQNDFVLDVVTILLQNRLFATLRESMSATYDPTVASAHYGSVPGSWLLAVDFACAPGKEDALVAVIKKEIARISKDPLDADTLDQLRLDLSKRHTPGSLGYEGWAQKLEYFAGRGIDPAIINDIPSKVDDLTIPQIKDWMQSNLCGDDWLRVDILGS